MPTNRVRIGTAQVRILLTVSCICVALVALPVALTNPAPSPAHSSPVASRAVAKSLVEPPAPLFVPAVSASKNDTLFTDVDGDGRSDPGDTLQYTVTITNSGTTDATGVAFSDTIDANTTLVPGSINTTPLAFNDAFSVIGNVQISIVAPGLLGNDTDADSDTLTASAGATTTQGGNLSVSSNGAFTYNPPPGFEGTDTFTYTASDGNGGTDTATVSLTVSGMIWFVDDSAAAGGDGRLTTPFNALTGAGSFDAGAADQAGDNIFLFSGAYTGGLTLLASQRLIGQGASDTLANITGLTVPTGSLALPTTGGASPTITSSANGVNLGSNNTIRGLTIGNTTGAGISGTSFGTLTVGPASLPSDTTINGNGQALSLTTGTLAARFTALDSTNSSATGITLSSVGGSLSTSSSNIQNPAGQGISVASSSVNLSITGTTTVNGSGGTGVSLTSNSGPITFAGLTITPDSAARGLHATSNTGTLTSTSGTVSATNAVPIEIVGLSLASQTPLAVTLTSVSGSGGSNGIILTNTSGSFTVVGTGTAGSGGTIATTAGADSTAAGIGIRLENASNILLARMQINDHPNFAIFGMNVTGFTLSNSVVSGTNGTSTALDEASVAFTNLLGSATISSCTFSGGIEDTFRIANSSGTLNRVTFSSCTFSNLSASSNAALSILPTLTAVLNVTVQNSSFTSAQANLIQIILNNSSSSDIEFTGNTLTNNHPTIVSNGGGAVFAGTASSTCTYDISNNTFRDAVGTALAVDFGGTTSNTSNGRIENNQIGVAAVANSGSSAAGGIGFFADAGGGTHTVLINNNVVRQYNNHGILVQVGDAQGAATTVNASVTNNTVGNPGTVNTNFNGIHLNHGVVGTDNFTSCIHIASNSIAGAGTGAVSPNNADYRLRQRQLTTVRLPGYGGANNNDAAVVAFVSGQQTTVTTGAASNTVSTGGGGFIGGAACVQATSAPLELAVAQSTGLDLVRPALRDILQAPEAAAQSNARRLTREELDTIVRAALAKWQSLGVEWADLARLEEVAFEIVDLPDDQLALATPEKITIDADAAGFGWFVDYTPERNEEFERDRAKQLKASATSAAWERMDLLTAVMRELDYVLEQDWWQRSANRLTLMQKSLPDSTRFEAVGPVHRPMPMPIPEPVVETDSSPSHSIQTGEPEGPSQEQRTDLWGPRATFSMLQSPLFNLRRVSASAAQPPLARYAVLMSGETVSRTIGTLPPGKTVTITFRVTIDNTIPANDCAVANQGTVSGSNFSNVVTDDPGTGTAGDATVTTLENADLSVTKSDSPDPVVTGSNITYTINFTNNGPDAASSVTVTDAVPNNTTFVSSAVTSGSGWSTTAPSVGGTGNVVFSKATVASGETATFQIVVNVNPATANNTTITNTATVASNTRDCSSANNTATATTTANKQADLAVTKSDSPDPVITGSNITYTVNFINNGPTNAPNVTVTDATPANTTFVSASVTTGTGWTITSPSVGGTGNVVFSKGDVANAETAVFQVVVQVDAATPGGTTITNNAVAASDAADPTPGNNTGTATTTAQAQADLAVTKSDSPDPVIAGNNITYTINLVNNGPGAATSVTVTDATPANTTFVSASVTTGTGWSTTAPSVGGTGNVMFSKGTVVNGETAVFQIVVRVNPNTASGTTITNTATAASTTTDPTPANDSGTATTTVNTQADLAVTKSDSPDPVIAGNNISYTINLTNNGPSDAQTVTVTDAVPANTTFVSATVTTGTGWSTTAPPVGGTGNVVFSKGTVASGETAVFQIVVNVNPDTANAVTITNTATAATATSDPTSGNDSATATTTVNAQADLAVTKSDSPDPVIAGSNITYTINFTNNGPSFASTVTLTDAVPANTTFVSASVTTGTGWSTSAPSVGGTGNIVFSKASVANGETAVFQIVVNVNGSATGGTIITNSAVAASATTDSTPGNNTGTATTTVNAEADLAVTKSDTPDPVFAGGSITYTINLVNNGPSSATTATVTDAVPANTTFLSATVTTGTGWSITAPSVGGTGNVVFSKAAVANGETAVFQVVVNVNASTAAGATITNNAVAASATADPVVGNNTGTATSTVQTQTDLAVTKSDSPDPVVAGNNITYTVNFTNNGPSDASTVTVTDPVPANTTFVSASVTSGSGWSVSAPAVGGTGNVVFSKATVTNGETAVFQIVVNVNASTPNGTTITNSATAESATAEAVPANNTASATTTVSTNADLAVTKSDSPDPVVAGTNLTYTINFVNNGPSRASTVIVTDAVPANATFVSASVTTGDEWSITSPAVGATGNVVFSKETVLNGETAVFQMVVRINPNTPNGTTITNNATAASETTDPTPGNNTGTATTTVSAQSDLSVTKGDSPDPVVAGTNLTYTINFTSGGPSVATSVSLTDAVPANTTFVSAAVTTGTGWTTTTPAVGGTGNVVFSKGSVAVGESAVFTIVVKVNSGAADGSTISNSATAASSATDPSAGNNTAIATTTVQRSADIVVTKTGVLTPATGGTNVTYTINLMNNGPSDAASVVVTDPVPANATFVSAAVTTGAGWTVTTPPVGGTGNVVFSKASVAVGETAVFRVVVRANAGASSLTNQVTTVSATADPVAGNNTSTAITPLFDVCARQGSRIFRLNSGTGEWEYQDCSKGTKVTGKGLVTKTACKVQLGVDPNNKTATSSATGTANTCTLAAQFTISYLSGGTTTTVTIMDTNITDNICVCP